MRRSRLFALATTGFCIAAAAQTAAAADQASAAKPFSTAITAAGFRAYDKAISSDYMDGRKPGTVGGKRATTWIIAQFKKLGLQPGNHGSWFQTVPTVSTTLEHADQIKLDVVEGGGTQTFDYGKDTVDVTLQAKPKIDVKDSPIVFVGYGIDAPDQHWNDYKGLDVKGKTVVVLVNDPGYATGDPKLFKGNAMTYYGRWTYKYEEAARQGAAMCLIVHTSDGAAGYPWTVVKNSWSGPQLALPPSEDPGPRLPVAGWLTADAAQRLFAKAGLDFDQLKGEAAKPGFKPVALKATASITLHNKIGHGSANNVLGLLKGSEHPDQVVIYSAHWDHFGEDDKLKGDKIFNGAVDNGAGISEMLEIAGAFAKQKPAPNRSVLFIGHHARGIRPARFAVLHQAPGIPAGQDRGRHQHGHADRYRSDEEPADRRQWPVAARGHAESRAETARPLCDSRPVAGSGHVFPRRPLQFRQGRRTRHLHDDRQRQGRRRRRRGQQGNRRLHRTPLPHALRQLRSEMGLPWRRRGCRGALRSRP